MSVSNRATIPNPMPGKLLRLPHQIRDQLNHRLNDGASGAQILKWINALPEVQAILKTQFDGRPITKQNLSKYCKKSLPRWRMRQAALEFLSDAGPDPASPAQHESGPMLDNLVHYLLLRLAALAQDSPVAHDPNAELRQIHEFLTGVVALRRGELVSRRLTLEKQRLSITQSKSQQELDQLFWAWTKRPDINSKLYPHRDPEKERRKVVHLIDQQLLGISKPVEDLPDPDPLAYI